MVLFSSEERVVTGFFDSKIDLDAKVESVVREKFFHALDPVLFCPTINNPGGATAFKLPLTSSRTAT